MDFIYGANGNWRDLTGLHFQWNFYEHCATAPHPADRAALIQEGSTYNVTAPDAHCILLGDLDNDGEVLHDNPGGFAFHEHAGRGIGGRSTAPPFYLFWFDDNWVARYMARAYDRPEPSGLHDNGYSIRWRLLGGSNAHWTPYPPSSHPDRIALNGIYRLNAGDFAGALADWNALQALSGAVYDGANQRYEYGSISETYHLALWAILSERLLAARDSFPERGDVLQHAVSLRSNLLSRQETDDSGTRLGWRTASGDPRTLMNTETLALAVLALGANADWVFEPGHAPLTMAQAGYFVRPHHVLSAVVGQSQPGDMVLGPDWNLPLGTYDIDFTLRTTTRSMSAPLANLEVDAGSGIVASATISATAMPGDERWIRYRLTATIGNPGNSTKIRVYWPGNVDLDVGPIRVTRRNAD